MKIRNKLFSAMALCVIGGLGTALYNMYGKYDEEKQRVGELKEQVRQLEKQEKQSAVMQSVNRQMEEIALQERRISDEQRDAAEQQTQIAERMRHTAETQRQNALEAEQRALQASRVAESQRQIAESQRAAAEYSKRVADTLSYLTLARQLGNASITQYRAGNMEQANLLAYAAYQFTNRYHGDIYTPTVYQALVMTSQSKHQWTRHRGTIRDIAFFEKGPYSFASVSSYGELLAHQLTDKGQLLTDTLFLDKSYDFRDVYIDHSSGTIFAVSRSGQLVCHKDGHNTIRPLTGIGHPIGIERVGGQYVIIGEQGLSLLAPHSWHQDRTRHLEHKVVTISLYDGHPQLFDNRGNMLQLHSIDNITTSRVPVEGQVTAFASSKNSHLKVYGMLDGSIWLEDAKGKRQKLLGHRSQVSHLKINGTRIYSSSLDGTLNLWMADKEKIEPMTILQTNGWLLCFTFDKKKYNIWCGDQRGTLTEAFISVPMMTRRLQNQLTRNLTREEWNYFIGRNVPYEQFRKN